MSTFELMCFSNIIQHSETNVRITSDDKMIYAVDLTMVITKQDRNNSAGILRKLVTKGLFPETKIMKRKLAGSSTYQTSLIDFDDAIELVMVLPGKIAQGIRAGFVKALRHYNAILKGQIGSTKVF